MTVVGVLFFGGPESGMQSVASRVAEERGGVYITPAAVLRFADSMRTEPIAQRVRAMERSHSNIRDDVLVKTATTYLNTLLDEGKFDPFQEEAYCAGVPYTPTGLEVLAEDLRIAACIMFTSLPIAEQLRRRESRGDFRGQTVVEMEKRLSSQNAKVEQYRHGFAGYVGRKRIPLRTIDSTCDLPEKIDDARRFLDRLS